MLHGQLARHALEPRDYVRGVFADSYRQASELWGRSIGTLSGEVVTREFRHPKTGPNGESLLCQTAWIGDRDATSVVVLISGTHGIEGFAGTAVQVDCFNLLGAGRCELPIGVALLCINALNPWGYAHSRRCDHDGIDVNRNFIDFSQALPENPGYEGLQAALRISDPVQRQRILAQHAETLGQRAYEIAISGGQYCDAAGPFYGGKGPSFSRRVIEDVMAEYDLAKRRLAVIDVHTGLGPYGYGEVICDHAPDTGGAATARYWYGPACVLPSEGTSSSVPKVGLLDYAWHAIMDESSCFVTLEFGTLGTASLFSVLLDEAACWEKLDGCDKGRVAALMREHFYPQDPSWREMVIFRSRQVLWQALSGVAS